MPKNDSLTIVGFYENKILSYIIQKHKSVNIYTHIHICRHVCACLSMFIPFYNEKHLHFVLYYAW